MREAGTYAGTMVHYGPSTVAFVPSTVEPARVAVDITVSPLDTAANIDRSHIAVYSSKPLSPGL